MLMLTGATAHEVGGDERRAKSHRSASEDVRGAIIFYAE